MILRRWLVGRLRRVSSLFVCLTIACLLLLLFNQVLKSTGLGRLLGHGWSGQKREMVQYYPHAPAGQAKRGSGEVAAKSGGQRTNANLGGREVRGRRGEVLNKLLDPLETNGLDSDSDGNVPESARLGVHLFYYAWYANPATDNIWWHWNHK